jgi:hypothetical protein
MSKIEASTTNTNKATERFLGGTLGTDRDWYGFDVEDITLAVGQG